MYLFRRDFADYLFTKFDKSLKYCKSKLQKSKFLLQIFTEFI